MADQSSVCDPAQLRNRVQPACHVTATAQAADILASAPAQASEGFGQVEFIYENPGADSLQFDEPIRLYPCKLCNVKCKRPYDLDRHHQTKHSQSQHWFCPIDTCKLSRAVPELSEILDASELGLSSYWYRSYRRPLTHEVLHTEDGCTKLRLHGFSRKDKLTKHLKKAHQEEILLLGAAPYGKGLSHTQPLTCEIQRFWAYCATDVPDPGHKWSPTSLCRSQVDGKWSEFVGRRLKAVAEAGFQRWTKDDNESYRCLVQAPKFHDMLPWTAHDLMFGDVAPPPIDHALQPPINHALQPPINHALQDYQMQLMLLEQQNKKRLMMARQEQDEYLQQPQDPSILDPAAKVQHQSMGHEAAVSDGSSQPNLPLESSFAGISIPASSSDLEDSPWSTANSQAGPLPNMSVEEIFAAFDWETFLKTDLDPDIDMDTIATDHADLPALDDNDPISGFDWNNPALNNAAVEDFDFDFDDLNSLPAWYFSAEDGAGPDI